MEETERIMRAGAEYGLGAEDPMPTNWPSRGRRAAGVRHGALSVDHLERMDEAAIEERGTRTMPTMLPGAAFFLGMSYPPAREMIAAGLAWRSLRITIRGRRPSGDI